MRCERVWAEHAGDVRRFIRDFESSRRGRSEEYADRILDEWLSPSPLPRVLMRAVEGKEVLGFAAVIFETGNEAVLEAVRVREDRRGRGIGQTVCRAAIEEARDAVPRYILRALVANDNLRPLQFFVRLLGFQVAAQYQTLERSAGAMRPSSAARLVPASPRDVELVWGMVEGTTSAGVDHLYAFHEWGVYGITVDRLREAAEQGWLWILPSEAAPAGVVVCDLERVAIRSAPTLQARCFVAANADHVRPLAAALERLALEHRAGLLLSVPLHHESGFILYGEGYRPDRWYQDLVLETDVGPPTSSTTGASHDKAR